MKTAVYEAGLIERKRHVVLLEGANLKEAYRDGANLTGAKVTKEQLDTAQSLQGATMPDGSIHD
jgi:uncharacterized protein YjbI with pentapeptide repeats